MEESGLWELILIRTWAVDLISHLGRILGSLSSFSQNHSFANLQRAASRMLAAASERRTEAILKVQLFLSRAISPCLLGWTNLHKLEKSKSPAPKATWNTPGPFRHWFGFSPTKNYKYREFLIKASLLFLEKNISKAMFSFQTKKKK